MEHRIVSREEWTAARKALLADEKAHTRAYDVLAQKRRDLPWVAVDKAYAFQAPEGKVSLGDLFDGRSQLVVQHFMLAPGWEAGCPGCSFMADHVDAARQHFEHADLSFVAVSRAPLAEIEAYKKRMGWTFRWVSSFGSDFNADYGVSFTPEQIASGKVYYNYDKKPDNDELHGSSVFVRDAAGRIFHTYSSYARGAEDFLAAFKLLDMTPKGRNETSTMSWLRRHDEYSDDGRTAASAGGKQSCCHTDAAA
jgi:predicted dithiol-disulfide oxidoreductase (DUF899 family)